MKMRFLPLALVGLTVSLSLQAAEVFCCSENYTFKPDGTVVEFDGAPPGALAEQNAIYSKARHSVSLAGARNETLAFQVVVMGAAKDIAPSIVLVSGPGEIPVTNVAFSQVGFVETTTGLQ